MSKVILYIQVSAILMSFYSCRPQNVAEITNAVEEWVNKEIKFDDGYVFTRLGKDSVYQSIPKSRYKVLVYTDSIGCISCNLRLKEWMGWMKQVDSISDKKVSFLFFIHPKDVSDLLLVLKRQHFNIPVCIDRDDSLNKQNHFSSHTMFQTFLLDEDNKVLAIGNPILNPKIKELYTNIILGENPDLVSGNRKHTKIAIDRQYTDLGTFDWQKQNACEFVLANMGQELLVVNNVMTSCGCIIVEYSKEPVQPGKELALRVTYKADQPEYFDKTITVYCNAENSPLKLRITGNAK